jgi:hypothetical protein
MISTNQTKGDYCQYVEAKYVKAMLVKEILWEMKFSLLTPKRKGLNLE